MKVRFLTLGLIFISCFFCAFFVQLVFSQNGDYHIEGGRFIKRIEYNSQILSDDFFGKKNPEKLFFGDFNAPVEFFYEPSFFGFSGLRVIKDTSNISFIIEVKHILNYMEAIEEVNKTHPQPVKNQISLAHSALQYEERLKHYKVETLSFSISNQLAEKLHKRMVSVIDNFKGKGHNDKNRFSLLVDGYFVVFRNIVDDEVWSLSIHEPQGNALKMSDLCRQIIEDAIAGKLDESKYVSVLDTFEN